jgi:hypothetical protein
LLIKILDTGKFLVQRMKKNDLRVHESMFSGLNLVISRLTSDWNKNPG